MRVTVRVSPFAPLPEVLDFTRRCEAAGFDGIGFLDSQMINRDLWVTMAAAATVTTRMRLITAVTNPVTRHISVVASSAASVDDLAPGRVEVWIGRGFSAVNLAGLPEATTAQLRTSIREFKRLLAGEWDVFSGTHSRMRNAGHHVPIYLAASGPRTIRLAGEVADGILLATEPKRESWERAQTLIAEGAKSAGRDPADVDLCVQSLTCIRETREEALRWAGPLLVLRLADEEWLRREGIEAKGIGVPAGLAGLYPDPLHAEDSDKALELASTVPLELRAQIADRLGMIGTPDDVVAKLKALSASGIRNVFMRTIDTLSFPAQDVDLYGSRIRDVVAGWP
ncbi:MAG TPA: LLM class flavin-dependent oxidoreductase [Dehalococcoidia bacterium]|nr:LLM class flavin-dependent oxidoreductase [Dehalococcoidia bacterium]